jgi:hypothetical protein
VEHHLKDITIPQELIDYLKKQFQPVVNTLNHELRYLDYRSGQVSVVEHLEMLKRRENNG